MKIRRQTSDFWLVNGVTVGGICLEALGARIVHFGDLIEKLFDEVSVDFAARSMLLEFSAAHISN